MSEYLRDRSTDYNIHFLNFHQHHNFSVNPVLDRAVLEVQEVIIRALVAQDLAAKDSSHNLNFQADPVTQTQMLTARVSNLQTFVLFEKTFYFENTLMESVLVFSSLDQNQGFNPFGGGGLSSSGASANAQSSSTNQQYGGK